MTIHLTVVADETAAAIAAADVVAATLEARPDAVIGFPTGATPLQLYRELARRVDRGELDLARVIVVALDEYLGVPPHDPRSFSHYLRRHVLEPCGISEKWAVLLDGTAAHPSALAEPCAAHERWIRDRGGVDLQIVGVGRNGHLGFNEPGTPFDSRTRVAALAPDTRRANAEAFAPDPVPAAALTQGLATIAAARTVLLLATGEAKAGAVAAALTGEVDPSCPASVLQGHPDVRAIVDAAAASLLPATAR